MRPRILLAIWLLTDLMIFSGSYILAYFVRVGWILSSNFPFDTFLQIVILVSPLWLLVLATTRTFRQTRNQATIRNAAYIAYAGIVGVALFTLTYYFIHRTFFSRLLLAEALIMQVILTFVWHIVYQTIQRSVLRMTPPAFPSLIIGVTRESKRLIETLNKRKNPLMPVAILDATGSKETEIDSVPVMGKLNKLEEVLESKKITHLIQCSDLEQSMNLLSACRKRGITYILLPSVLGIVEGDEQLEFLEGYPVTIVQS